MTTDACGLGSSVAYGFIRILTQIKRILCGRSQKRRVRGRHCTLGNGIIMAVPYPVAVGVTRSRAWLQWLLVPVVILSIVRRYKTWRAPHSGTMALKLALTYYSDVLCVWAYISQARVDEVAEKFPKEVSIDYRFCSVFGDTAHKIGIGWAERGGYAGFGNHLREAVSEFSHVKLHPDIWQRIRPTSSTPAHILLKAVQRVDKRQCRAVLQEIRLAFFERCLDISSRSVLEAALEVAGVPVNDVREVIDSGLAHADLEADHRDQTTLMVQGSPTFVLNDGRQKLYGNVGYGVIEANIKELLRSPVAGAASWC